MACVVYGMVCFLGAFRVTHMHDTVPMELWPLTDITQEREVMKSLNSAVIHPTTASYTSSEVPKLGYKALMLAGSSYVTVSLQNELHLEKFMLMGMFYVNLHVESNFFQYNASYDVFSVYTEKCNIHVKTTTADDKWPVDDCTKEYRWYTVTVKWNSGKMYIFVVWADPNDDKGETVINFEAKDMFQDQKYLPAGGSLYVGHRLDNGPLEFAVCCLRIYDEEFDKGHVEDQMYQDCEKEDHWTSNEPNPCGSRPCQNGGICYLTNSTFACTCKPWFTGPQCETEKWMAHQDFTFITRGDVRSRLNPMVDSVNLTVSKHRECATLCLRDNYCLSFTVHDGSKCTLYRDYTFSVDPNESCRYYIVSNQVNSPA